MVPLTNGTINYLPPSNDALEVARTVRRVAYTYITFKSGLLLNSIYFHSNLSLHRLLAELFTPILSTRKDTTHIHTHKHVLRGYHHLLSSQSCLGQEGSIRYCCCCYRRSPRGSDQDSTQAGDGDEGNHPQDY